MLLCLSSRHGRSVFEWSVEVAGEVALQQPCCVAAALALGYPFRDVVLGRLVVQAAVKRDRVQCAVELTVAAAAEAMSLRLAAGGGDRVDAGETGEAGFRAQAAGDATKRRSAVRQRPVRRRLRREALVRVRARVLAVRPRVRRLRACRLARAWRGCAGRAVWRARRRSSACGGADCSGQAASRSNGRAAPAGGDRAPSR
jgi:hypothetical protein